MAVEQKWIIFWSMTLTNLMVFNIYGSYGRLLLELNNTFPNSITILLAVHAVGNALGMMSPAFIIFLNGILGYKGTYFLGIIPIIGLILMTMSNNVYQLIPVYGLMFCALKSTITQTHIFLAPRLFPYNNKHHFLATSLPSVLYPLGTLVGSMTLDFTLTYMTWEKSILIFAAVLFVSGVFSFSTLCKQESQYMSNKHELKSKQTFGCACQSVFVLWAISWLCKSVVALAPLIIMAQHAESLGMNSTQGASLLSILAMAEGASRFVTSLLGDKFLKGRTLLMYIWIIPFAIAVNIAGAYCTLYWQLILYCIFTGISSGPIIAGGYSVNNELLEGRYVNELFAVSFTFRGVGLLVGSLLYAAVRDKIGGYHLAFYINAVFLLVAFVTCCILQFYKHIFNRYLH